MMFGAVAPPSGVVVPMLGNTNMSIPPPPPPPQRGNMILQPPTVQYHFQQQPQQQQHQQSAPMQQQQPWQQQQQQQQQPLTSLPTYGNNAFSALPSALSADPGSFVPANITHPMAQITAAPTLDILGLAEKAAQALSGIPGLTPISAPATNMRADPRRQVDPRAHHQKQSLSRLQQNSIPTRTHNLNHNHNLDNPSRDDDVNVALSDLPPMVQYAVQNLRSSGHLEKDLGQNACRWLKKLSEPMSLKALERFSSCDVTQMRSKEGYLCGILKKALDQRM